MAGKNEDVSYEAVVIGVSAGGFATLEHILPRLPKTFVPPILIVQHLAADRDNYMVEHFRRTCKLAVLEGDDKVPIESSTIYFAPPNYHMMVELDKTIALTIDKKVNYSRPSIDVLFESASRAYREKLIGIILTGANEDGAYGQLMVKSNGGLAIVQSPETAEVDVMPIAALSRTEIDHIFAPQDIAPFLISLAT